MLIEFDSSKAASNFKKHGVSFEEAATVLYDPMALVREDDDSVGEQRWLTLGMSGNARLLLVVHTVRHEDTIRIISARKATKAEAKYYA
jgi:uncharacterized DUF497 family protein